MVCNWNRPIMSGALIASATGGPTFALANVNVNANSATPAHASAVYSLESDGDVQRFINGAGTDLGDWIIPKFGMSSYECRMDTISGSLTSGTVGTWLALSSTRNWQNLTSAVEARLFTGTISIRRAGTSLVLASATIQVNATETA